MNPQLPNFVDGQEGIFFDMADDDYRKASGISNSMLKALALDGAEPGSPAHFLQSFKDPQTDSDALFVGRMVHSRILTPDVPLPGIVEIPAEYPAPADCSAVKTKKCKPGDMLKWFGGATYCKQWLAAQKAAGLRPMDKSDIEMMDGIVNAVANHPICKVAFKEGKSEVSLFKRYHRNGGMILKKGRLDWISPGPAIVDIKTCQDARACEFDRVIWTRRYYVAASYYLDLYNELHPDDQKTNFIIVAVEKFAPYAIQVFDLNPTDLRDGRDEYKRNLALVMECMKQGEWPAYPDTIQPIKMRAPYNRKTILQD